MASLSHPNIVSFKRREDLASHVVLVLDPWFGFNMRTHIINNGPLTEGQAQTVITQVTSALIHMHLKGVTHGTVCLDNIVTSTIDRLDHVILAGFHHATSRKGGEAFHTPTLVDAHVPYTAPEGFGTSEMLAAPMDVWAVGVVYFALLHGRFPFGTRSLTDRSPLSVASLQATSFNIKTGAYTVDPTLSPACRFAIRSVFTLDARNRPDVSHVLRLYEKSVTVPSTFLSSSEREQALVEETDTEANSGGNSSGEHSARTVDGTLEKKSQHGLDKSVKFPSIIPIDAKAKYLPTEEAESATPSVADSADGVKGHGISLTDTYAKLTQMALSTLERAKNAATQGKKISSRNVGVDTATSGKGGSERSSFERNAVGGGVGAGNNSSRSVYRDSSRASSRGSSRSGSSRNSFVNDDPAPSATSEKIVEAARQKRLSRASSTAESPSRRGQGVSCTTSDDEGSVSSASVSVAHSSSAKDVYSALDDDVLYFDQPTPKKSLFKARELVDSGKVFFQLSVKPLLPAVTPLPEVFTKPSGTPLP